MWIAMLCICILAWNFASGLLGRYLHARKRRAGVALCPSHQQALPTSRDDEACGVIIIGCAGRADPDVEVLRARDYKVGPDNVRDDNDFSPGLAQRAPANLVSPPSTPARRKGRPGCEPRRINRDVGTSWHMDALTECLSGQNRQLLFHRSCLFRTELKNRDNSRRIERQLEWQTEELFHGRASIGPSSAKIRLLSTSSFSLFHLPPSHSGLDGQGSLRQACGNLSHLSILRGAHSHYFFVADTTSQARNTMRVHCDRSDNCEQTQHTSFAAALQKRDKTERNAGTSQRFCAARGLHSAGEREITCAGVRGTGVSPDWRSESSSLSPFSENPASTCSSQFARIEFRSQRACKRMRAGSAKAIAQPHHTPRHMCSRRAPLSPGCPRGAVA